MKFSKVQEFVAEFFGTYDLTIGRTLPQAPAIVAPAEVWIRRTR
jgi:hypothetical protein